jgi:hypothetical protein
VIGIILVLPFSVTAASRVTLEKLLAENRLQQETQVNNSNNPAPLTS